MHCCLNYLKATFGCEDSKSEGTMLNLKWKSWSTWVGMKDGWKERRKKNTQQQHQVQSLEILGCSLHQAVVDFLYKHIHLMYFSNCWMICILFSLASWFKTIAFWILFLRILVCEFNKYISKIICNFCSEYVLPSITSGSYISNEGSTIVNLSRFYCFAYQNVFLLLWLCSCYNYAQKVNSFVTEECYSVFVPKWLLTVNVFLLFSFI